ncbi:MAG: hypothetical protein JWQ24_356 [Tardiphaga sp.]|nr:hypothetical protein [Tardiphaga sp.]
MRHSSWIPSIVPSDSDQTVYLVIDCDGGGHRCVWREADVGATDLETVLTDLLDGQYPDPEKVVAFNLAEGWSRDVSKDLAREIRRRCDMQSSDPPSAVQSFVERNELRERQLTLRLA